MKLKLIPILSLFLLTVSAIAQDYVSDFKKINEAYTKGVEMDIKYAYYNFYKDSKPYETVAGKVKQSGSMYHILLGDIEMINNKWFKLIINKGGQILTLDSSEKVSMKEYYDRNPIEQLTENYSKIEFKDQGKTATYKVYPVQSVVAFSEINVEKATHIILSISIFFKNTSENSPSNLLGNKLVISYSNVKTGVNFSESEFSIDKYILKNKNQFQPQWAYKSYEFINMISN